MSNTIILIVILITSALLAVLSRIAAYNNNSKIFYLLEIWRDMVCYFVAAAIGYFFLAIRLPHINNDGVLSTSDFVLGITFLMGILGWLPYFVKNITEGIQVIISKVLNK